MPKTKRAKVVHLTKTKKKTRSDKDELIEKVREASEKFGNAYLIRLENVRNAFLKDLTAKLRPGRLFCGKNKVLQVALGTEGSTECADGIHNLARKVQGHRAILFTDLDRAAVTKVLSEYTPEDYARAGAVATRTVTVPAGTEALAKFPHSLEPQLRKLGMPTLLKNGIIHLLGNHVVCKEGQTLDGQQVQVLKLLDEKMVEFRMVPEGHWCNDGSWAQLE